jgi:excisionase family DNA binding protein
MNTPERTRLTFSGMTPAEFAARAGLSDQTVRSLIGMRDIEATDVSRPGARARRWRIAETEFKRWWRERTRTRTGP